MIGVGLAAHERPGYYAEAAAAIVKHLGPVAGWVGAAHDGPDPGSYPQVEGMPLTFLPRRSVAASKNHLLRQMIAAGCTWLFLSEDDVVVDSPLAVLGYVEACIESGWHHLAFHGHVANDLVREDGIISYWWIAPGAWTVTTRAAVEAVGMLDEGFVNCHEHLEWDLRLAEHGYASGWRDFADATGSEGWLHEQPDAVATSTIRADPEWAIKISRAWDHWRRAHPTTYAIARSNPAQKA